jgi:hypothetical protein
MTGYNRVRGVAWPVTFRVDDGHAFTVYPPERGPGGSVLRCRVDGGARAGDYEIGEFFGEQSAGGVIDRTIRWWVERTGIGVSIDPRRK